MNHMTGSGLYLWDPQGTLGIVESRNTSGTEAGVDKEARMKYAILF